MKKLPEIVRPKDIAVACGCAVATVYDRIKRRQSLLWMQAKPRAWPRRKVEPLLHEFLDFSPQGERVRAAFGKVPAVKEPASE